VFVSHAGLDFVVPGAFGVTVFFFLSGYLITTLMRVEAAKTGRVNLKDFYLRRALRILPLASTGPSPWKSTSTCSSPRSSWL
jgi:peptidoglycan/LPS O-acetylase OafA/YrhL